MLQLQRSKKKIQRADRFLRIHVIMPFVQAILIFQLNSSPPPSIEKIKEILREILYLGQDLNLDLPASRAGALPT